MDLISEACRLHEMAWKPNADYLGCMDLALILIKKAYDEGNHTNLVVNNYAAILLDLHRDKEALELLEQYEPECFEYCSNYSVAAIKLGSNISEIRKWNGLASQYPRLEKAIVAYIDLQAL